MIYLTYKYHRDVFLKGGNFKPWVKKLFGSFVRFHGFDSGMYKPTLQIHLVDFEKFKDQIPLINLIGIEGKFSLLQKISLGVRDFKSELP